MNRKPVGRVVALRGNHRRDVVTQADLRELEQAQLAVWHATKRAGLVSERIKVRIAHGADVEEGSLYFDEETELARTRKQEGAG